MAHQPTLDFYIRKAWLKIYNQYQRQAQAAGYSFSAAYLLLAIDRKEGTPATQLGPKTGLQKGSLTRVLRELEAEGIIMREAGTVDKRIRRVFLTERGLLLREQARNEVLRFQNRVEAQFSAEELANFKYVLQGIIDIAEEG
jgi:MarR family transcriptional regulator, organic hydroperoxide resistance regulator